MDTVPKGHIQTLRKIHCSRA